MHAFTLMESVWLEVGRVLLLNKPVMTEPRSQHRVRQSARCMARARVNVCLKPEFLVPQRWISLNLARSPWQRRMMNTLQRRLC